MSPVVINKQSDGWSHASLKGEKIIITIPALRWAAAGRMCSAKRSNSAAHRLFRNLQTWRWWCDVYCLMPRAAVTAREDHTRVQVWSQALTLRFITYLFHYSSIYFPSGEVLSVRPPTFSKHFAALVWRAENPLKKTKKKKTRRRKHPFLWTLGVSDGGFFCFFPGSRGT